MPLTDPDDQTLIETEIPTGLPQVVVSSHSNGGMQCDILLFVAARSEKEQLEKVCESLSLPFTKVKGEFFEYFDLGRVGSYSRVMAVRTEIGPFGHGGSTARALLAKSETHATSLVSLGMAFGVDRNNQNFGDVLVSKTILPYDNRAVNTEGGKIKTDYGKVSSFRAKESLIEVLSNFSQTSQWKDKVRFGAMLTGGARVRSSLYRDELIAALSHHGEPIVGGEMEGAGLLAASIPEDPTWIIVKGICDFGDEEQQVEVKIRRESACENAATFVLTALLNFDPESEVAV